MILKIRIFDKTIGYMSQEGPTLLFEYDADFLNGNIEISPFMLPKASGVHSFNDRKDDCFKGLPHFIADALPDNFGNMITNAAFAKIGRSADSITILERLSYLGKRAIGALEFEPVFTKPSNNNDILELRDLTNSIKSAIAGKPSEVEGVLISISSAAGGARAKAIIGYDKVNNIIVSGHKDIPDGFEHYLIKFDGLSENDPTGYSNIEYAYYLMAIDLGINMTESFLLTSQLSQHFITKRFDRVDGKKIHTQTLCSVIGSDFNKPQTSNYADYFNLANLFNLGYPVKLEMFRRMVFNVILANRDDHTKNFSFLIDEKGNWSLAPAYDITHAYNNTNPNAWTREHNLLINGKGTKITKEDLTAEASALLLKNKEMESIIKDAQKVANNFTTYAKKAKISAVHKNKIIEHLKEVQI